MSRKMKESGIEWIGEIPTNWKLHRIQYYLEEINEKNNPIKTTNVLSLIKDKGVMLYKDKGNKGNKAKEDISEYKVAYPNTLVVNSMNILIGSVGISDYYGCVSPVYYVFRETEKSDLRFINYIFQTREFQKELKKYAKGILEIRMRISSSNIFKRKIPFPDKKEQQKIANYLDEKVSEIDKLITKTKESIEEYKKYKQLIITNAVTNGLNPNIKMKESGIGWIGKIPNHWEKCKVKYMGFTQNGLSIDADYFGSGYPFVSYSDVYNNFSLPRHVNGLVQSTNEDRWKYSVVKGDIFFTRTSETIEEVGYSSVCEESIENATFSGFLIRLRLTNDKLITGYAKYYFRSLHNRFYLVKEMNLVTRASLSQPLLKGMTILIPPKEEQLRISNYLDKKCFEIDELIEKKNKLVLELEKYKKSLIYEYVTGKKEVK